MSLELIFEEPGYVSINEEPEFLVITLSDFHDPSGNLVVEK